MLRERVSTDAARLEGLFTEAAGWCARRQLPKPLRRPMYTAFARWVGARIDEAELPLEDYPSFCSFFARSLRPGVRAVDPDEATLCSPCDGIVVALGTAKQGTIVQAKGNSYRLDELIANQQWASRLDSGSYITIYLAPKDYHRVHAPYAGELTGYQHIPGSLLPVSPRFRRRVPGLFAKNERVVLRLETAFGPVAVVMVAALGVGNVVLSQGDLESRHLRSEGANTQVDYSTPIRLDKGDDLAAFHVGSTVVAVFPPNAVEIDTSIVVGTPVRFGQRVAQRRQRGAT